MTGHEFVACAERLSKTSEEADLRSAVSRAYYGAFHEIRDLLHAVGVRVPKTEQVHVKMEFCLRNCGDPIAGEAGQLLFLLRGKRKVADYDLDDKRYITPPAVKAEIARARKILEAMSGLRTNNDAGFRSKIRAHAKLLGLTVSD